MTSLSDSCVQQVTPYFEHFDGPGDLQSMAWSDTGSKEDS